MGQIRLLKKIPGSKNYKKGKILTVTKELQDELVSKGAAEAFGGVDLQRMQVRAIANKEATTQAENPQKDEERLASRGGKRTAKTRKKRGNAS